jgi:hypothetical protein
VPQPETYQGYLLTAPVADGGGPLLVGPGLGPLWITGAPELAASGGATVYTPVLSFTGQVDLRRGLQVALSAHGPLTTIVGGRIRPGFLGQQDVLPALTYLVISDVDEEDLDEDDGTKLATVQLDCWAETLDAALRINQRAWQALKLARSALDLGGVPLRWLAPDGDVDAMTHRGDGSDRAYARVRSDYTVRYIGPTFDLSED